MRALKYKLKNGTVVNTLAEARASKEEYEIILEPVAIDTPKLTPIRKAMLDKLGYVSTP